MSGLTDDERASAYEHFDGNDIEMGRCYLEADVLRIMQQRVDAALAPIEALLPDECWVTRSVVRCTDFVGGTVELTVGVPLTEDLCCLPCRLRAAIRDGRGAR